MTDELLLSESEPERLRELRALSIVDTPIEERFDRLTRLAKRLFHAEAANVVLRDATKAPERSEPKPPTYHSVIESWLDRAVESGCPIVLDLLVLPALPEPHESVPSAFAALPLHVSGQVIGVFYVLLPEPHPFTRDEVSLLTDLAKTAEDELEAGVLVESQRSSWHALSEARREARVDPLTRLWNRRACEEFLAIRSDHASKESQPFLLAIADIDHFKRVNDTLGHLTGDGVLRILGRRLLRALRASDLVGRYGGEEFVMAFDCHTLEEAEGLLRRIEHAVSDTPFAIGDHEISLTITIGAAWHRPGDPLVQTLARADHLLYQGKRAGRHCHRLEAAEPTPAPSLDETLDE